MKVFKSVRTVKEYVDDHPTYIIGGIVYELDTVDERTFRLWWLGDGNYTFERLKVVSTLEHQSDACSLLM